jgi:hypothetical protein
MRQQRFVLDGEAVCLTDDGISDFDRLQSHRHDDAVQLYAFDCLALDGDDLRALPLSMRKTNLARLLARPLDGIFVAPFEQGEIGGPISRRLLDGARRPSEQTTGSALSQRPVEGLNSKRFPYSVKHAAWIIRSLRIVSLTHFPNYYTA